MFVCDNLAFRGDLIALRRKHTSGLNLRLELAGRRPALLGALRATRGRGRTPERAGPARHPGKGAHYDAFAAQLMPVRFLPEVSGAYFDPQLQEFAPRNAWSLHNAFTGAAKVMPITTRLPAIQALGKFFGMSAEAEARSRLLLPA